MASTVDRSRLRRERTFVGSECAVCDEPLEHTLQGERILQFSCTHVAHEACFYEFIRELDGQHCPTCEAPLHLDTSRGGNVIDISSSSTHGAMCRRFRAWVLTCKQTKSAISFVQLEAMRGRILRLPQTGRVNPFDPRVLKAPR